MGSPQAFGELARAMHHARYGEALALIDALLVAMPEAGVLQRQRAQCLDALARDDAALQREQEIAAAVAAPELIRVDPRLFDADQRSYCDAPAPALRTLGFEPLLDAASPQLARGGSAPMLIRFFGDESGDALVLCFAAQIGRRSVRLLACVSEFADGPILLTHREAGLQLASDARVDVLGLARHASLTELVARHAGRVATQTRNRPGMGLLKLSDFAACDRVWRGIGGA